jgi:2-keto-4-pentenoate hydratase
MTDAARLDRLAARLWEAGERATPLGSLDPTLAERDAYAVQMRLLERALLEGDRLAGWKVAFTSQAVWEQLGVREPAFGPLLASRMLNDGGSLQSERFIRPGVEAEIAFHLAEDLPPPPITAELARRMVARVLPTIEVVDSRCRDWRVTGPEAIADSACAGAVVVGTGGAMLDAVDLPTESVTVTISGKPVAAAKGAAALGDPFRVLVWLANRIADVGQKLRAGGLILTGSLAPIQWVKKGAGVTVSFEHLGSASVRFL